MAKNGESVSAFPDCPFANRPIQQRRGEIITRHSDSKLNYS